MTALSDLARAALLGTRTAPLEPPTVADPAAAALIGALQAERVECTLLRWAALLAAAEAAAIAPARPRLVADDPAPDDPRPLLPAEAARILDRVLDGRQPALLDAMLVAIAASGWRIPPALLPAVLTHGSRRRHREAVRGVLCGHARWLAGMNPAWRWALDADESAASAETEQAPEQGAAQGGAQGAPQAPSPTLDPDAARARLEAFWSSASPQNRLALEDFLTALEFPVHFAHDQEP
jgi:hypothetical protein